MKSLIIILALLIAPLAHAQSIDLLWSANTYKPPFYQGHTLATPNSLVKVVAVVNGVNVDPSTLDYRWQKNGQTLSNSSGVGKGTLTTSAELSGQEHTISVQVSNTSKSLDLKREVKIRSLQPQIVLYQDAPLTGVDYSRALGSELDLMAPEIRLLAEPYFFPEDDVGDRRLSYTWKLNDQPVIPDSSDNRLISFTAPEGATGASVISLEAKSLNNILQRAKRELKIKFGVNNFDF